MVNPTSILHLGKYYPPHMGGIEIYLQQLVSAQSRSMDVEVIVANDFWSTTTESLDGAQITRVARFGTVASLPITPAMPWHVHQSKTQLVHLHTPNPGAAFALSLSGHPGKLIITHHADTVGRKYLRRASDQFVLRMMERAAAIIVTSQGYLNSSQELAPFRDKCRVIPLGIDVSAFKEAEAEMVRNIRALYGERLILSVGRLVSYKGFEYLIQSMRRVNGVLLLVGRGRLQDELRACIGQCGVQDKVRMLGFADQLTPYYQAARVFVIPSTTRAEAFGMVQMEAMASGLPVINTDIPSGVPEVSVHEQTGLTVPPKDPEALANAINLLLDSAELRKKFGTAAQDRVRTQFSLERMIAQTKLVYEEVLQTP